MTDAVNPPSDSESDFIRKTAKVSISIDFTTLTLIVRENSRSEESHHVNLAVLGDFISKLVFIVGMLQSDLYLAVFHIEGVSRLLYLAIRFHAGRSAPLKYLARMVYPAHPTLHGKRLVISAYDKQKLTHGSSLLGIYYLIRKVLWENVRAYPAPFILSNVESDE